MRIVEVIPGQGILKNPSRKPEIEILQSQFDRHDTLLSLVPGFVPAAISPYSFGILAGGAIANSYSRETAFQLAGLRADIVRQAESKKPEGEQSAMGVFLLGRESISDFLSRFPSLVWTNDNGPGAHVLGGPMNELKLLAEEAGRRFRGFLTAEGAYHSPLRHEDALLFREKIDPIPMSDPEIPIIPSTGKMEEIQTATQLKDQMASSMTEPVKLEDIVAYWTQKGYDAFFDISAGASISKLVSRINPNVTLGSLEEEVEKIKSFFSKFSSNLASP